MYAVKLADSEFGAFVESLDGDIRIISHAIENEVSSTQYDGKLDEIYTNAYHHLILSGTRPETKPTI